MEFRVEEESINIDDEDHPYRAHLTPDQIKSSLLVYRISVSLVHSHPTFNNNDLSSDNTVQFLGAKVTRATDGRIVDSGDLCRFFNGLGVYHHDLHRMFFNALEVEASRVLNGDNGEYLRSYLHGNTRKVLKIYVNFASSRVHQVYVEVDDSECRFVPTAKWAIDDLEKVEVGALDEAARKEDCSVCLERLETQKMAKKMPCQHVFHGSCIVKWLKSSHFCPLCRFEMPTDMSDEDWLVCREDLDQLLGF